MEQIKNRAGQVFADFDEWKKWAEQPSEQHPGHNNVLPELVRFLGLYPHLLDSSVSELVEQCTENIPEDFYDRWTLDDDEEVIVSLSFNSDRVIYDTLEELSPDLALRYAKHAIMDLEQKEDGTYRLKAIGDFSGNSGIKCLTIPEFVTEIDTDALADITLAEINFPDTFNTKNKIRVSLYKYWGNGPSINTIHPLDIEVKGASLEEVVNGRFDIKYTTFKSLCELYPAAFEPNEEGKVWADNSAFCTTINYGGCDYRAVMIMLSGSEKFVQITSNVIFPHKPYSLRLYNGREMETHEFVEGDSNHTMMRKRFEDARIVAVELLPGLGEKHPVVLPDSVDTLFIGHVPDELIIEGNPHNVFYNDRLAHRRVVVNAGIQELNSREIFERYKVAIFKEDEKIIFNLPTLCAEKSIIPGYIRATLALRDGYEGYDVITEINTKFIVSMHPEEITLRNKVVTGTIIHMASNGIERHQSLVVYEPMEVIAEKIKNA